MWYVSLPTEVVLFETVIQREIKTTLLTGWTVWPCYWKHLRLLGWKDSRVVQSKPPITPARVCRSNSGMSKHKRGQDMLFWAFMKKYSWFFKTLKQIHDVEFCQSIDQLVNHTLPALAKLKLEGKARFVGITGYSPKILKKIVERAPEGSVDVILSYCRMNLINQGIQYIV